MERAEGEKREGNRKIPTTSILTIITTKRLGTRTATRKFAISKLEPATKEPVDTLTKGLI